MAKSPRRKARMSESCPRALLYWRIRRGYSLFKLAKQVKLSQATLHRLETGRCRISARAWTRIREGLGLNPAAAAALLSPSDRSGKLVNRTEPCKPVNWLQRWRFRNNLSLERLAKVIGVSTATLFRFESGYTIIGKGTIRRIKLGAEAHS